MSAVIPNPLALRLKRLDRWGLGGRVLLAQTLAVRWSPGQLTWTSWVLAMLALVVATFGGRSLSADAYMGLVILIVAALAIFSSLASFQLYWLRSGALKLKREHGRRNRAERGRVFALSQLALLQAHADPDFLFNNLASLQYLGKKDPKQAAHMLSHLVNYLRLSLSSLHAEFSTLGAQIDLVDSYLQLAAIRMGKRVFVQVSCPGDLKTLPFLSMVVHALAENALRHGADPCLTPVIVEVRAYVLSDHLIVDVVDDGVGLSGDSLRGWGNGLKNVRSRLKSFYGDKAQLIVVEQRRGGVLARIQIKDFHRAAI